MAQDSATPFSPMQVRTEDFTRLVSALFDSGDHAEKARQDLIAAGVPDEAIAIGGADMDPDVGGEAAPHKEGFWETLKELFMPDEDRHSFAEGMRRGGITISVKTDTATHDRVIDILDRDGAVDLDEREESWRSEGWTGYTGGDPIVDRSSQEPGLVTPLDEEPAYTPPSNATAGFAASAADHFPVDTAPTVESPGALPETERVPAPDLPAEAPAADTARTMAAPPVEPVPPGSGPAGEPLSLPDGLVPTRVGIRDLSHGRSRIRAYVPSPEADKASGSET